MLNLVLGDQLFPEWSLASTDDEFLLIECRAMCARYRYHQQKLVLIFSSMRRFAQALEAKGFRVHYVRLESQTMELGITARSYFELLEEKLRELGVREIRVAELADRAFASAFAEWGQRAGVQVVPAPSHLFLTPTERFPAAFGGRRPFMKTFYEWQRKRLRVLVDESGEPTGGQWSYDAENRKKLPRGYEAPLIPMLNASETVAEVIRMVERDYADHPGKASQFWLPTEVTEAHQWLDQFLVERLEKFGPYEDALRAGESPRDDVLNHSVLSPMMNLGILPPATVVTRALHVARERNTPIASLEGFLRQVIGWREFVKGIDVVYGEEQASSNFFGHSRTLKPCWYDGTTGLLPVDAAIRKALRRGYNHHIERLMVLSNVMLLCDVDPREVHRWFMEMNVDSSEWVMGPNVYGMGQFSDGGIFATKPYICGSNYILKMSDFPRGEWCDTWDALYWNFVDRHQEFFRKNPRMGMAGNLVAKMPAEKRAGYRELAEAFRERTTQG